MAERADGSIIIDVDLDAEGFRAGSAELQRAVKSFSAQAGKLGPAFQKAMSGNMSAIAAFDGKAQLLEGTMASVRKEMLACSVPASVCVRSNTSMRSTKRLRFSAVSSCIPTYSAIRAAHCTALVWLSLTSCKAFSRLCICPKSCSCSVWYLSIRRAKLSLEIRPERESS